MKSNTVERPKVKIGVQNGLDIVCHVYKKYAFFTHSRKEKKRYFKDHVDVTHGVADNLGFLHTCKRSYRIN